MLLNLKTMDTNGNNSNSHENQHSEISNDASKDSPTEQVGFVNHAEIAWHERRRQWVGDQSQKSKRMPREPIMSAADQLVAYIHSPPSSFQRRIIRRIFFRSWSTTYEDLLCSTDPFHQPIPLAEMVDFLVDIWHEEGLYD